MAENERFMEGSLWLRSLGEFKRLNVVVFCGMMCALAIVLNMVASINVGPYIRIGFSGLPNQAVAYLFGPAVGGIFGAALDVIKYMLKPDGAFFPGFTVSAGIGFDAAVCQRADSSSLKSLLNKISLGKLIYISEAVHMILASPMVNMKITCDSTETSRPRTLFAVVMNTCYEGGGFKFCPDAVSSDGVLNLFGANNLNRMNFFRIFPTAYNGNHLRFKGLFTDSGKSFTIRSAVPLWVHTDGEVVCKSSNITIDVYPHKLQLMV